MNPIFQWLLSLALALFGARGLLFGVIDKGGADGGGPLCQIRGRAARLTGALLLAAAVVLLASVAYGLLIFLSAVILAWFACRWKRD